jgi:hypothetical protein
MYKIILLARYEGNLAILRQGCQNKPAMADLTVTAACEQCKLLLMIICDDYL